MITPASLLDPEDDLFGQAEHYADHELDAPSRAAFENRLLTDSVAQAALAYHEALVTGIRVAGRAELRARFARLDAGMAPPLVARVTPTVAAEMPVVPAPTAPIARPAARVMTLWPRLAAAAAAVVVLAAGTWGLLRVPHTQAQVDQYGLPDPGLPVTMSDATLRRPLVAQAMNSYKSGEFADALAAWEKLPARSVGDDTINYYRGIFLLRDHRPAEATRSLSQVSSDPRSAYHDRAEYYEALALWADGQISAARVVLTRLASQTAHPLRLAARDVLPLVK